MTTQTKLKIIGINRYAIAQATGVRLSHISRIFNPNHPHHWPSLKLATEIARHLDVSVEEFIRFMLEDLEKAWPEPQGNAKRRPSRPDSGSYP